MKRLLLLVLCFCLVAASAQAGASGNSAKKENPRQAGKSSIYFYDVESKSPDSNGYGRLVIDTAKKTFVFIGQDFTPYQEIRLQYKTDGDFAVFAKGRSTPSGNLHIAGTWEGDLPTEVTTATYYGYPAINGFHVENDGGFVIKVGCHYTTDLWSNNATWYECPNKSKNMSLGQIKIVHLEDLGVPLGAWVDIKVYVALGPDQTGSQIFTYAYADYYPGYCYAHYTIQGVVWEPWLRYWSTQCETTPGADDWWVSDLP